MPQGLPPRLLEAVFHLSVVFGPLAFGAVEGWSVAILQALAFLLLAGCLWTYGVFPRSPVYASLLPALASIAAIGLVQSAWQADPASPALPFAYSASPAMTRQAVLRWAAYCSLAGCAPLWLSTEGGRRRLAWSLLLLGSFIALVGYIQEVHHHDYEMYFFRKVTVTGQFFGPYYNRNHAASLLGMSLLAGVGLFLDRARQWRGTRGAGEAADVAASQALIVFLCGLVLFAMAMTRSRGAAGALAASCALVGGRMALGRGGARGPAALPVWAGLTAALASLVYYNRATFRLNPDFLAGSSAFRLEVYRACWEAVRDHPFLGHGLGAFSAAFPYYQEPTRFAFFRHAHSDWLQLLVETGLVGWALLALGLGAAVGLGPREAAGGRSVLRCGLLAAFLFFVLHALVEFSFQIPGNAVIFLVITAAVACSPREQAPPWSLPVGVRASGAALSLLLAAACSRPAMAWWFVHKGERGSSDIRIDLLAKAVLWQPGPEGHYRLACAYRDAARQTPSERHALLRSAVYHAAASLRAEPLTARYRLTLAETLWGLERRSDARGLARAR